MKTGRKREDTNDIEALEKRLENLRKEEQDLEQVMYYIYLSG